jgi:hypothetical protein
MAVRFRPASRTAAISAGNAAQSEAADGQHLPVLITPSSAALALGKYLST